MDKQQSSNSQERPTRRHTMDTNTESIVPRYDFVLPSYSRDRRKSSITTTVPPEAINIDGSANVNISIPEQGSSSTEIANNKKGTNNEVFSIISSDN